MKPFRRRLAIYVLAWLVATILTRAMSVFGLVAPVELAIADYWHRLAGVRAPAQHVALAVIDDASLETYKDDPLVFWTPHVARAVAVLREAGAAVVGLDFMFSISPERWLDRHAAQGGASNFDLPLRQEIASGRLIMVASAGRVATGESQFLLPATEFLLAVPDFDMARHIGLADLVADVDGVTRHFIVAPDLRLPAGADSSSVPRLSFAALMAARASGVWPVADANRQESLQLGGRSYRLHGETYPIAYPGPPGHVPRIPFAALLAPDALSNPAVQALRGRVVIIGGEYAGMNDTHATPYVSGFLQGDGSYMTGPEVQAGIVETLLSGRMQQALPVWIEMAVAGACLLVALALFLNLRLGFAALALPVLGVAAAVMTHALFMRDWLFPLAALLAGLLLLFLAVLGLRFYFEERERNRITRMFGRYVSDHVVEEMIASGQPPQMGGVRQIVTVLFSDIRSFTVISERLAAEEVVEMLNRYFGMVCQAILDEGGTIDKFIGDAIMVLFGAPVAYPDHADRALRSALRIQEVAREFAVWMHQRFPDRGLPEFAVGVGVHTGPVVVGNVGSVQRTEYTAIGDTVNAASRIESATKELHCAILASDAAVSACRSQVTTGKTQSVLVKGKSEPLILHEVLDLKVGH